jgi:hypothetical protein
MLQQPTWFGDGRPTTALSGMPLARSYRRDGKRSSSASVADVWASAISVEDVDQCRGQVRQIAVVEASVVELVRELGEQPGPIPSPRRRGDTDLHRALDDPNGHIGRSCRIARVELERYVSRLQELPL